MLPTSFKYSSVYCFQNWGKQTEPEETEKLSEDVDASLEEELAALKAESKAPSGQRRFQVVDSGVNGIVFIKTTVMKYLLIFVSFVVV